MLRMDYLSIREMRIAGMSIGATLAALLVAETGGSLSLNIIRAALAVLALAFVLFADRLRPQL